MAPKNKTKNNNSQSGDKPVASQQPQEDAAKRSPRAAKSESAPVSSRRSASDVLLKLVSALLYLALAAGAVLASLYVHRELTDIKLASSRHDESARKCASAAHEVEIALQQVSVALHTLCGGGNLHTYTQIPSKRTWVAINLFKKVISERLGKCFIGYAKLRKLYRIIKWQFHFL